MLAATVIAVTLVPVLCTLLLGGKFHAEEANPVMRVLRAGLPAGAAERAGASGAHDPAAAILFAGALVLARGIGSEFMPPLNEGDLMFMPIADPSISLEENTKIAARQNAALMKFPEVEYVVAKVARADTSTDPAPLNMTETIVHLKPKEQWRSGMTLDRLRAEMGRAVQMPGVSNIWTMPIINRIDMLTTGIRSEVGVKIFGTDLHAARGLGAEGRRHGAPRARREQRLSRAGHERSVPEHRRRSRRRRALRHRRRGRAAGHRDRDRRDDADDDHRGAPAISRSGALRAASIAPIPRRWAECWSRRPTAHRFPLGQVARIEHARGPAMISSENGLLLATVLLNVQGRDVGGFVEEARATVARDVALPAGYYIGWSGRWENQERARAAAADRAADRACS